MKLQHTEGKFKNIFLGHLAVTDERTGVNIIEKHISAVEADCPTTCHDEVDMHTCMTEEKADLTKSETDTGVSDLLNRPHHRNTLAYSPIEDIGSAWFKFQTPSNVFSTEKPSDDLKKCSETNDKIYGPASTYQTGFLPNENPVPLVAETDDYQKIAESRTGLPYAFYSRPILIGLKRNEMLGRTHEAYARNSYPVKHDLKRLPLFSENKGKITNVMKAVNSQDGNHSKKFNGHNSSLKKAFSGYLIFIVLLFCFVCLLC